MTTETRTIGTDNGIGDIFTAIVSYSDNSVGHIVVYGGNLQGASSMLNLYAKFWNFTVTDLF